MLYKDGSKFLIAATAPHPEPKTTMFFFGTPDFPFGELLFSLRKDWKRARLLHITVVGGGPTGMEFAAEMQDFIDNDVKDMFPELQKDIHVTLIEAAPGVLPMFTKSLITYTENLFKNLNIKIMTKTVVKDVNEKNLIVQKTNPDGSKAMQEIPYGMLVWAAGITARPLTRTLMSSIPEQSGARKGLIVDEFFRVKGVPEMYAVGDCAFSGLPATAQVANQQGAWLAKNLNVEGKKFALHERIQALEKQLGEKEAPSQVAGLKQQVEQLKLEPFKYHHQGALAYVGDEKAIADLKLPFMKKMLPLQGIVGHTFWRLAYLNELISARSQFMVLIDWLKTRLFGRYDAKV